MDSYYETFRGEFWERSMPHNQVNQHIGYVVASNDLIIGFKDDGPMKFMNKNQMTLDEFKILSPDLIEIDIMAASIPVEYFDLPNMEEAVATHLDSVYREVAIATYSSYVTFERALINRNTIVSIQDHGLYTKIILHADFPAIELASLDSKQELETIFGLSKPQRTNAPKQKKNALKICS